MDWSKEAAKFGGTVAGSSGAPADWASEAAKYGGTTSTYVRPPDALDNPNIAVSGMPDGERLQAGLGKWMADRIQGAKQLIAPVQDQFFPRQLKLSDLVTGGPGSRVDELRNATAESDKQDRALMSTGAGMTGNVLGHAIPAIVAPIMAPEAMASYLGSGSFGALQGLFSPSTSNTDIAKNVGFGTLSGLGGQLAAKTIGRLVKPVQSALGPEETRLAAVAAGEGIPLDVAQLTGSKPLQTTNAVFEHLPFTAGPEAAKKAAQQTAFNRAVLNRAGVSADQATPDVLAAQRANLGQQFEGIASRNNIDFNSPVTNKLASIVSDAEQHLPPDAAKKISGTVDQIFSQVDQSGVMSGTNYQGWRSPLNALARKGDETSYFYGQIKKALDGEFSSQISGTDAQAWKAISQQYANLKTVTKAMGGAGVAPIEGNISPAQLSSAFTQGVGKEGKALGRGDLNDLVRVGQKFVRNQVPNSGTAQRMLYQNLLTGGGGAGLGAGLGALAGERDPTRLAEEAAVGMGAMYSPRLIQSILNSPAAMKYFLGAAAPRSPEGLALVEAVKRAAIAAGVSAPALTDARK